jgi:hypothetical protein
MCTYTHKERACKRVVCMHHPPPHEEEDKCIQPKSLYTRNESARERKNESARERARARTNAQARVSQHDACKMDKYQCTSITVH